MTSSRNIKIFTGNANSALADEVVDILGLPLGKIGVGRFSDGEISVSAAETVRGCDVFLSSNFIKIFKGWLFNTIRFNYIHTRKELLCNRS